MPNFALHTDAMTERKTIAVTRNGRGDLWIFDGPTEALEHPIVQYGDAIMSRSRDISRQYNRLDIGHLLSRLGDETLRERVTNDLTGARTSSEFAQQIERYADLVWGRLLQVARLPPSNPDEVIKIIIADRRHYEKDTRKMADTKALENKKERKSKYEPDAKITWNKDKDGKVYSKDNCPKREGSKSAERFMKYAGSKTVKDFMANGGTSGDLDNDAQKGYLSVA